jgi:putative oxidoreductase
MKYIVLLGRIFFSFIFIKSSFGHFSSPTIEYASKQGVWMPSVLVPLAGVIALLGGLSILLGYKAKIGAWLIVLFLVPVTLKMHNFWMIDDLMARRMQLTMFTKNISILGGALMITYFGAGPMSIDQFEKTNTKAA